jgi:polyphosphate kinase 2 (PPK2 family)
VGLKLTDYESAAAFAGDYPAALAAAQERLQRLQLAQIVHGRRAIVLVDGWEGAGRRQALRLLAGSFDPCRVAFHGVESESARHWLAPYWSLLPRAGETAVFLRGWYGGIVDARVRGELADKEWARAFDEINEFEAQQTDHGTLIAKLFFHVGEAVQARRLRERAADPWLRWTLEDEGRSLALRADYHSAWEAMFARSNTRWAGWTIVDAGDERAAPIAMLTAIAATLEKALPAEPPAAENVVSIAVGKAS